MNKIYEEGPLDSFKSMALRAEIRALKIEHDQVKMNLDREQMELLELRAHVDERRRVLETILSGRLQKMAWRVV